MLLLVGSGAIEDPQSASSNLDDAQTDRRSPRVGRASRDLAYLSSPLAETAQQYKSAKGRPSEFRAALRRGVKDLATRIDAALAKVRDVDTAAHLKDLRAELDRAL
jgi:hypothetical protein